MDDGYPHHQASPERPLRGNIAVQGPAPPAKEPPRMQPAGLAPDVYDPRRPRALAPQRFFVISSLSSLARILTDSSLRVSALLIAARLMPLLAR